MSCCLKAGFSVYGSNDIIIKNRAKRSFRFCSSLETLQFKESISTDHSGKALHLSDQKAVTDFIVKAPKFDPVNVQQSVCVSKSLRWWDKSLHPNMVEIQSAQELVHSLSNAADRLVILDFYSPGY
ncbi:hypothetical protein CDL12_27381 [Handroanthus impetiginosus]|uniref:Uncharacterized protein n=1 Tax=Handroanthus impetiginosus TaxID=429701 RepID=A0A2G9G473_9LAMI|nr:hypothetical protein CDL12_27381 [Handroanthus impetiginosus]